MPKQHTVIDAQFHLLPPGIAGIFAAAGSRAGEVDFQRRLAKPNAAYSRVLDAEGAIRHMDECGVDMAVIPQPIWLSLGLDFCRMFNDGFAELVRSYPGRFLPCAHVPYMEGQPALDELERAVNYLGMKAVAVVTSQQEVRLDDPGLKPFFRKVSQLGIPVIVHPTVREPLWGGTRYNMSGSVSREYEIIKAFVEVLQGVLPEFPDLNFVFAHYAGGAPFLLGRIMSYYEPPKGTENTRMIGEPPRTIREFEESGAGDGFARLLDHVYFDLAGAGGWLPALKQALLVVRPDHLCFATDYPHEMARTADLRAYMEGIQALGLSEEDKANIFGGNIRKLLKL
ncbi:MAG: amidohydrolase [Chloroflexi bacterium]|nr:amidohydrolase [Chloroflexota bacterium]